MIKKILIANRGEIAVRVLRACRDLGIVTVSVYSTPDINSEHVLLSDESVCIGPASATDSYLNMCSLLTAATITGADAIHPGVGFLSENADFAKIVEEHGIKFIGPSPEHISTMGDKITAKETMRKLGVPLVPGSNGAVSSIDEARRICEEIGYPVLLKAAGGGGGKGIGVVRNSQDLEEVFTLTKTEAANAFGRDDVYIEKFFTHPRHIEVQIIADQYGNVLHLGERDCSIQRRRQKVWEEARADVLTDEQREELYGIVVNAVKSFGYEGVGTLEFLYEDGKFYFIEMNTRIQVEHTITECVTGIDLVKEQILVAGGKKLTMKQSDIKFSGHAIECRINAEDPESFFPSPGLVKSYHAPGGIGVRIDSYIYNGYKVPSYYDSLVAKLIVHADTRQDCIMRLRRALDEYVIDGIKTTIPLHKQLCTNDGIVSGEYDITFLDNFLKERA